MKNLFSINRTEDTHSVRPDSTPFDAEHIDSALEEQLRQASDAAFEAFDQPLTPPRGRQAGGHGSWQLGLGLLLTIIAIVPVFLWRDTLFSGDRAYFAWILLALLIAGGVLVSWAYRIQKKTMMQETRERQEANASGQNAAAVETAMKEMTRLQRQGIARSDWIGTGAFRACWFSHGGREMTCACRTAPAICASRPRLSGDV